MKKNKKGFAIISLLALCVILVAVVFKLGQPPRIEDGNLPSDNPSSDVVTGNITDSVPNTDVPSVKPEEIPPQDSSDAKQTGNDIPLTVIEEKPKPPEVPNTAANDGKDESHDLPKDPALENPSQKPNSSPKPTETAPPKENTPNAGDKNGNGEVFIPGFGWVKDEGGGGQGQKSELDPEHSDFDKIIGN